MKTLKFRSHLADMILSGEKTVTWRLFDDKDLAFADKVEFINWDTNEKFAEAEITSVEEHSLEQLWPDKLEGHETYENFEDMLNHFKLYYGDKVDENTIVKVLGFKLL
ncbi:MAG TPA: ASCH domain-containing protein [Patescibacteria group bacterium]|jgi:hypothetical protein|nr:ASCH domain-containing protein [Patescibacteria group bacterium]